MSENEINILNRKLSELIWSEVYHDTIRGSKWLRQDLAFSPGRGAIGYQLMYVLYRILNEVNPTSILELGMGQSTKMIGSYTAYRETDCKHYIVEHDEKWIEFFTNHFQLPPTTTIVKCDITDESVQIEPGKVTNITTYVDFKSKVGDNKYDLIVIDGPYGYRSPDFSRINILDILPACIGENFVIIMDDCDRVGERNTCGLIGTLLTDAGITYYANTYTGEKDATIFVSQNLKFLCLM